MLKLQVSCAGEPEQVVECVDVPAPVPGAADLLVRVLAAPINPADLLLIRGRYGTEPPFPFTPGFEAVGRVEAMGAAVEGFAVGDLVLPLPGPGAWSEQIVVAAAMAVPLPAGLDPAQASMIKVNPATALLLLQQEPTLQPGDWVVQSAANSAVGHYLIQIARRRGLRTLNVVRRAELAAELKAIGADAVVTQEALAEDGLAAMGGAHARLAIDAVGGEVTAALGHLLQPGAPIVAYGLLSGAAFRVDAADVVFRGVSLRGFWLAEWFKSASETDVQRLYGELIGMVARSELSAPVEARYPFQDWQKALVHADQEARNGKVLFVPGRS
jgi:NADPH:quinone reductase-like Zn-dependent oxidoreductase